MSMYSEMYSEMPLIGKFRIEIMNWESMFIYYLSRYMYGEAGVSSKPRPKIPRHFVFFCEINSLDSES